MAVRPAPLARPAPVVGRPLSLRGVIEREGVFSWLMLAPGVLFLLAFVAYPFFYGIYLSLQDRPVARTGVFVGLANFATLARDAVFWQVTRNMFVYTIVTTVLKIGGRARHGPRHEPALPRQEPGARLPAPALHRAHRAQHDRLDVDPRSDLQRDQLAARPRRRSSRAGSRGSATRRWPWCRSSSSTRGAACPSTASRSWPGLQTISPDLYEAAAIDGATTRQRFRHVTLPIIKPVLIIVTMFSVIFTFSDFQLVYALTHGGPANATQVFATYAFDLGMTAGSSAWARRSRCRCCPRSRSSSWSSRSTCGASDDGRRAAARGARTLRLYLPLSFFLILMLFPFYWMLITSIKPNRELYNARIMPLVVHQPTLKHYVDLLTQTNFLTWTYNTLLVAIVSTVVSLVLGTMIAYPLARMNFPGAAVVAIGVAATYLVPQPLLFIPMADIINRLDLGNTLQAVMLTYPTLLIPFCAWLLMGYFKSVPRELEEAARIDGASRFQAMTRVVLPLCTPGLLSAGIFAFTLAQNEFLYALIFLAKSDVRTVPVGAITELIRGDVFYWGQLMAAALLGSIPVALIYSFFVEYYVAGLTAGSVKS